MPKLQVNNPFLSAGTHKKHANRRVDLRALELVRSRAARKLAKAMSRRKRQ